LKTRLLATMVLISTLVLGLGATAQANHCGTPPCFGDTVNGTGPFGLRAQNASTSAGQAGLVGQITGATGPTYGVFGLSASTGGQGVRGEAAATSGQTYGVLGLSASPVGHGVYGSASAASGINYGVHGRSASVTGRGVLGDAIAGTGVNYGVWGQSASTSGTGVYGLASAASGNTIGMFGRSDSTNGRGVLGVAGANTGSTNGVKGESYSSTGIGVYGLAAAGAADNSSTFGVYGKANADGLGSEYGVYGISVTNGGRGVAGIVSGTSGTNYGVYGQTLNSPNGYAGYFSGRVHVNGTLSKSAGSFKIDHPLDPANKYLSHSFVESPDMLNIYNGNVTLDQKGVAVVEMPLWFEALNKEFRYQLTAIGAPGPELYVASEIQGNHFTIAGGKPGIKVSWQVTGVRHDAYAEAHRIPIEEDKPAQERGTYLSPTEHGQPQSKGLDAAREMASAQTHEQAPQP
jgi:hypothetical protein